MNKYYYNQHIISSNFQKFFKNFSISLPNLKSLSFFITGLLSAESVVTADVSRKLKDDFSLIQLESVERRFRRFFKSFSYFAYSFYNSKGFLVTSYIRNIKPLAYNAKVLNGVFYTRKMFKTTIVVSNYSNTDEVWYLVTNDVPTNAIKHYSYRFGSVECIFKSQKSNRL